MSIKLKIVRDPDPESPREWDNLGTMVCWHDRYKLGDEQPKGSPQGWREELTEPVIILPLYLYDHSGITMSTGAFSCPWDSGQVGYIYITLEDVRKEYKVKRVSPQLRKRVEGYLRNEVETYDMYLRGDVWGYQTEELCGECGQEKDVVDSCWGFFGDDTSKDAIAEHLNEAAREQLDEAWSARE